MRIFKTGSFLKILSSVLLTAALLLQAGCASQKQEPLPVVRLSIWCSDEADKKLLNDAVETFKNTYSDKAGFEINIGIENVMTSKETVLANPAAAADIYTFADDQFSALRQAGALLEITENTESIISANGGTDNESCRAAMYDNRLYAYPLTVGNGYFLYYDSKYFTEDDIKSLDRILEISAENGKKTAIDYSSGWYIYSFFKGAGLELGLNEDGNTNYCNWNSTDTEYTGIDVAESMLDIAGHPGFISSDDKGFVNGVKDGTIIAGINGAWNAETLKEAWGNDFAASMLPCYTLAGDSVQMCSFSGHKMLGVNSHTKNAYWAMKLAEYLSGEEMQLKRFEAIGECPSNIKAAASPLVEASPVVSAMSDQSRYAYVQQVTDSYWNPSYIFGITIAGGNPDNQDLQKLLDTLTEGITATPDKKDKAAAP